MSDNYVVLSGCSGGGKSSLLRELQRRGYSTVEEPGRRIVQAEIENGGSALPWIDMAAFSQRAIEVSIADYDGVSASSRWIFFDRGLVDAAAALEHASDSTALDAVGRSRRYNETVFLAPPWPEIYLNDAERRHDFAGAIAEYERLALVYPRLGYRIVCLPKVSVIARADFVLATLNQ